MRKGKATLFLVKFKTSRILKKGAIQSFLDEELGSKQFRIELCSEKMRKEAVNSERKASHASLYPRNRKEGEHNRNRKEEDRTKEKARTQSF